MTTAIAALAPVVDALVRAPVADWCVSEMQAFLAELVPKVQRLDGLVSMASGQLQDEPQRESDARRDDVGRPEVHATSR